MKNSILAAAAILVMMLVGTSCDKSPDSTLVRGTVTFKNVSVWKPSGTLTKADVDSGLVEVTIFGDGVWTDVGGGTVVPAGAPYNAQNPVIFSRVAGDSTYKFEIEVPPGTYSALAVGFRTNRNVASDKKTATLGVYWNRPDSVSHGLKIPHFLNDPIPSPIVIAKGDELTLNFVADFGFVNTWFH